MRSRRQQGTTQLAVSSHNPKRGWQQGYFTPRHPEKYKGDVQKIRYMSMWELKFDQFLDNNTNVIEWNSEEIAIPYVKPTTGRVHKYYPDYWVKYRDTKGKIQQAIIEIKPENQSKAPRRGRKKDSTFLRESLTYAVNIAKWRAATQFCNKYGMKFRLVSENKLFI